MSEDNPLTGVDGVYAQLRRSIGEVATAAPRAIKAESPAPGVQVLAVRTPTLPPATTTNCVVLGDVRGPLIAVDPATPHDPDQQLLAEWFRTQGSPLAAILLSHHHRDHVGAAMFLRAATGARIVAHAETAARLPDVVIDDLIADGAPLGVGDYVAIHTPGHAQGHVVAWSPQRAIMAAGDMVAGVGTILIDPVEGDMGEYLRSLERMASLAPAVLVPAHGPTIHDGVERLLAYRAHRLQREQRVLAAVHASPGASADQLCTLAYADTPPALWPLATLSVRAHLNKLVQDDKVIVDGGGWVPRS